MEKLTQEIIDEIRKKKGFGPQSDYPEYKRLLLNNAEALLKAAEYFLCDKEGFESITGNDYETSLGLMVYGKKAKEFFREMEICDECHLHTLFEERGLLETSTAKAAGLLEGG